MITIHKTLPNGKTYTWGDSDSLSDSDLDAFKSLGAEILVYWYVNGGYDGSGSALFCVNGLWHIHNMGHCSCYGPTENLALSGPGETLEELRKRCSQGYSEEVEHLFECASTFE